MATCHCRLQLAVAVIPMTVGSDQSRQFPVVQLVRSAIRRNRAQNEVQSATDHFRYNFNMDTDCEPHAPDKCYLESVILSTFVSVKPECP